MNLHVWADHRPLYHSLLISPLVRKSRLLCSGSHIQQCYQEKSRSGRNATEGTWRLRFSFHPCKSRPQKKSDIFGKVYFGNKSARQAGVRGSSSCLQVKLTVSHRQHKAPFTLYLPQHVVSHLVLIEAALPSWIHTDTERVLFCLLWHLGGVQIACLFSTFSIPLQSNSTQLP